MENLYSLMVFAYSQPQGMVLHYKTLEAARSSRDALHGESDRVRLTDDYGRELIMKPVDVQITLLQDIDAASQANLTGSIKNNAVQMASQMMAQNEAEKIHPDMKTMMAQARFAQSGRTGAILS